MADKIYICIDLKSFYASVECIARNLDPLTTNLVVADASRTDKTICLAVSPSLKAFGVPSRPRLFEAKQKVKEANGYRLQMAPGRKFKGASFNSLELADNPGLAIDFIVAPPRMAQYIKISTRVYEIYLKYIAPEDIHIYSVDEVFIDVTPYLDYMGLTPYELAVTIIRDVLSTTGITATVGIGTNMYLAKVAMDIVAKKAPADKDGVRIAELDEISYRQLLWDHRPLTDFWRIGRGYSKKLEDYGLKTMGDIARCSIGRRNEFYNEDLLYKLFGVNAELLIDHAWGFEPCTIEDVKAYRPENSSLSSGQVLHEPYTFEKARIIVREMAEAQALDLVSKRLVTDQIVLTVGYDKENLSDPDRCRNYKGKIKIDHYGRKIPVHAHGTFNLGKYTSSTKCITDGFIEIYDRVVDSTLLIRRVTLVVNHVNDEMDVVQKHTAQQLDLFTDYAAMEEKKKGVQEQEDREKRLQWAILEIKNKYGKNAILKGTNFEEGATAISRNAQIGGHKA